MRIITVDTILLCGMEVGQNNNPEGYPADKEYAKWAWDWIDRLKFRINSHAVGIWNFMWCNPNNTNWLVSTLFVKIVHHLTLADDKMCQFSYF